MIQHENIKSVACYHYVTTLLPLSNTSNPNKYRGCYHRYHCYHRKCKWHQVQKYKTKKSTMKTLTLSKPMNPNRIKPNCSKPKLTINLLRTHYSVFQEAKPLAVGTHRQLFDAGYSQQDITRCLSAWTRTTIYLKACIAPDSVRFNLNGSESGEVLPADRTWAQAMLDKRSTKLTKQ